MACALGPGLTRAFPAHIRLGRSTSGSSTHIEEASPALLSYSCAGEAPATDRHFPLPHTHAHSCCSADARAVPGTCAQNPQKNKRARGRLPQSLTASIQ
jgi:hypothetical protein